MPQGFDIGFGGEVCVEKGDMFFGERLDLPFGEAALGQTPDLAISVERDGLRHGPIIATRPARDKDNR